MNPENLKNGDSDDLEAIFNEIADQRVWDSGDPADKGAESKETTPEVKPVTGEVLSEASDSEEDPHDVFTRVGHLTRKLHDALRELGYDAKVENAVGSLPDARARLSYIASLTGDAANKVLASVEKCQHINDVLAEKAIEMDKKWEQLFKNEMSLESFKAHAYETHQFIKLVRSSTEQYGSEFTEIMMSQDFHDLTGQVVNRIADMAQNLEEQLVKLLLDTTPAEHRKNVQQQWLTGPAIDAENRTDVCNDQSQVDDLLESLGF